MRTNQSGKTGNLKVKNNAVTKIRKQLENGISQETNLQVWWQKPEITSLDNREGEETCDQKQQDPRDSNQGTNIHTCTKVKKMAAALITPTKNIE